MRQLFPVIAFLATIVFGLPVQAQRSTKLERKKVELFAAIDEGIVELKLIPKDATVATVIVKNKTQDPLSITMPESFVGVPVLAQFGGGGGNFGGGGGGLGGGGLGGGGLGGGGGQSFGGGFGGGGGGFGGGGGGFGGGGGGVFNVAPEGVTKKKVTTVCLEHGKDDPNPRRSYTIQPLSSFTEDSRVAQVIKMLAAGEIAQPVAQAAAWHFTDNLSFDQLARKVGVQHLDGSSQPFFARNQVVLAARVANEAMRRAGQLSDGPSSPGDSMTPLSVNN